MPPQSPTALLEAGPPESDAAVLRLSGRLDAYSVGDLWDAALAALATRASVPVIVDATGVAYCDGAGVALLVDLLRRPRAPGAEVRVRNLRSPFDRLLRQFDPKGFEPQPPPPRLHEPLAERVGELAAAVLREGYQRIAFVGEAAAAVSETLATLHHVRWREPVLIAQRMGADAVP